MTSTSRRFFRVDSTRKTVSIALMAILGAGLLWRLARYFANWPLWGDEAYIAVSLMKRDFAGLARPLEYYQIAPPGFLWAELAVIRLLGASELALRLLPFLSGVASLFLFWKLATTTLDRRSALLAVAFFSVSFYPIRHANEVKPYALDLLLALIVLCLAIGLLKRPDRKRGWAALIVVSLIGVWVSYPLILVAGGVGIVLAYRLLRGWFREVEKGRGAGLRPSSSGGGGSDRAPSLLSLLLCMIFLITTLASWVVMYWLVARPQALAAPFLTQMETWENSFPPMLRPWKLPWWFLTTHTGNMMAYPYGGNHFGSVATTLLVVVGGIVLWRKNRGLLVLLLAPLGPAFVAAALHRYPYGTSARISLFMAPAICLLAGQGLMALIARHVPRTSVRAMLVCTTATFALFAVAGAVVSVVLPYKEIDDLDLRQVVQSLGSDAEPGDRWLVFNGLSHLPEDKSLMLMPWLQHAAQFHFYVLRDAPVPLDWNPDPSRYVVNLGGRTLFVLHQVGWAHFPTDILKAHMDNLVCRLGSPRPRRFEIRKIEYVDGLLFDTPRQADRR